MIDYFARLEQQDGNLSSWILWSFSTRKSRRKEQDGPCIRWSFRKRSKAGEERDPFNSSSWNGTWRRSITIPTCTASMRNVSAMLLSKSRGSSITIAPITGQASTFSVHKSKKPSFRPTTPNKILHFNLLITFGLSSWSTFALSRSYHSNLMDVLVFVQDNKSLKKETLLLMFFWSQTVR